MDTHSLALINYNYVCMWTMFSSLHSCFILCKQCSSSDPCIWIWRQNSDCSLPLLCCFESYEKYLCRSDCRQDEDVLVKSTEATKGRYSTSDDRRKRIFMTTISNLSPKDEGRYWCGVTKVGFDKYPSEVSLKVKKGKKRMKIKLYMLRDVDCFSLCWSLWQKVSKILKFLLRNKWQQHLFTSFYLCF